MTTYAFEGGLEYFGLVISQQAWDSHYTDGGQRYYVALYSDSAAPGGTNTECDGGYAPIELYMVADYTALDRVITSDRGVFWQSIPAGQSIAGVKLLADHYPGGSYQRDQAMWGDLKIDGVLQPYITVADDTFQIALGAFKITMVGS